MDVVASSTGRIPVWLDCDPGHDDAMAIILAGWNDRIQLLGISTVASNQTVTKVTRNALDVLHVAGLHGIGVVTGAHKPLMRPAAILCPEIHGESGLDGPDGGPVLPHSGSSPMPGKAVNVMFEAIHRSFEQQGAPVRLVCTGALTNAATLLLVYPEVVSMCEVVIMGGCMGLGNTGPVVEFNIQTDPEAAKVVFESGIHLTMIPLEVTHTALVTPQVVERILTSKPAISAFKALMQQLLTFFANTYQAVFGFEAPPLHDPCAVACVIAPHLFEVELMRVDIETCSQLSAGQTVCDVWRQSRRTPNCHVARRMDVDGFWQLMLQALDLADASSPMNHAPVLLTQPQSQHNSDMF